MVIAEIITTMKNMKCARVLIPATFQKNCFISAYVPKTDGFWTIVVGNYKFSHMMTLTVVLYQMWFHCLRKFCASSDMRYEDNDFANVFLHHCK